MWVQISDFWDDTRPASHDKLRRTRMNELPVQIPERAILLATRPGDVVLDCFAGGGSTLHAAQLHQRLWIGCDTGDPNATMTRIATFFGAEEKQRPPSRVKECFDNQFLKTALRQNTRRKPRRKSKAGKISKSKIAADKYASKSRIF